MSPLRLLVPAVVVTVSLLAPVPGPAATAEAGPAEAGPAEAGPADSRAGASTPRPAAGYAEYVALGDSWTADVVLLNGDGLPDQTYTPIDCAQSHHNYPKLVAARLGVRRFRDASCGSATTHDFAHPQRGLPLGGTNAPQFDRLTRRTDLVTVGIGGNDAGIASAALDCLNLLPIDNPLSDTGPGLPLGGCRAKYTAGGTDRLSQQIQASERRLVRAFRRIHERSPKARILALDYLAAVPPHACYPRLPATETDVRYLHARFKELNAMIRRAARRGGAEFVNTFRATRGHDVCQGPRVRYAEVLGLSVNDLAVGVPAHPNTAGAHAQAAVVLKRVRHPRR